MSDIVIKCKHCNKPIIRREGIPGSTNPYWVHDRKEPLSLIYCLNNKGNFYRKSLDGRNLTATKP